MPTIIKKSITTLELKERLIQICRSENGFRHLKGLDWEFVKGDYKYTGKLDLSQQIAFLELGPWADIKRYQV
jgi:hypothetical protein